MRFVDEVELHLHAGRGGRGAVSYRREAHVPLGGPDGGHGGCGGDIYFEASSSMPTLLDLKSQRIYRAENGASGGGSRKSGKNGSDIILKVPVGTIVTNVETQEIIADLVEPGELIKVAAGGKGGRGNVSFVTATRRAPDFAQDGLSGDVLRVVLSLKLIADVGLVGLPNAGKSTLITKISSSKARVADYPFTTLVPNLGVVSSGTMGSYVVADIPGLVHGAHEGAGLGHQFLRHVERTKLLIHMVSASPDRNMMDDFETIERELRLYASELLDRPRILVINQIDLVPRKERESITEPFRQLAKERGIPFQVVSCMTGEGLQALQRVLDTEVSRLQAPKEIEPYDPMSVI